MAVLGVFFIALTIQHYTIESDLLSIISRGHLLLPYNESQRKIELLVKTIIRRKQMPSMPS